MYGQIRLTYVIRVQLRDEPPADYHRLHELMEEYGCTRIIDTETGRFHLPDAEYCLQTAVPITTVRDDVLRIASREDVAEQGNPRVLVMEVRNWSFELDPV